MRMSLVLLMVLSLHLGSYCQRIDPLGEQTYTWQGKITSNIPVFLWFTVKDSVVIGQMRYTKVKSSIPIQIIGFITQDGYIKLNEFSANGNITGILYGKISMGSFSGTWFSPSTKKELVFSFKGKDTLIQKTGTETALSNNLSGKYYYQYGKKGAQGNLIVHQLSKSLITVEFYSYTDAPARNSAELKLEKLNVEKNVVKYKLEDANSCAFRIIFFKGFVVTTYIKNQRDCGFGNGAEIEGVYIKIH